MSNESGEPNVGNSTAAELLLVQIRCTFEGRDAGQVRRALARNEPLSNGQPRVASKSHAARAPRLGGDGLNQVMTVLALSPTPPADVALGVARAARIGVDNGIASAHPLGRVQS